MTFLLKIILLLLCLKYVLCSVGDYSPYYQRCLERCSILNCTKGILLLVLFLFFHTMFIDGLRFKLPNYQQPLSLLITRWTCEDECKYDCMWKTVDMFHRNNWATPQFYGKVI